MKKIIIFITLIFLTGVNILNSTSLVRNHAVKLNDINIEGQALPDSIVKLIIVIESNIDDSLKLQYEFDGHMSLASGTYLQYNDYEKSIFMSSSSTFRDTLELRVEETGSSNISLMYNTMTSHENQKEEGYHFLVVSSYSNSYTVIDQDSVFHENLNVIEEDPHSLVEHNFIINGKAIYKDIDQHNQFKGLYKSKVYWWFVYDEEMNLLHQPVINSGNYNSTCDINGNFEFGWSIDYNFQIGQKVQIALVVEKANDACALTSGGGDFIITTNGGNVTTFGRSQYILLDIDPETINHTYNNTDIIVNSNDGSILRNAQLTREFYEIRYTTLSEPSIVEIVRKNTLGNINWAGLFHTEYSALNQCTPNWIEIRSDYCNTEVISHEYGHYVHFRLAGLSYNNTSFPLYLNWVNTQSALKEGWAMFYSFSARSYNNNKYGEEYASYRNWGDTERSPFYYSGNYRFANLSYYKESEYCSFASYLQNIYDSYTDGDFMHGDYDYFNNDDIGLGALVFQVLDANPFSTISGYHSALKQVASVDKTNSINDIWQYMFDDEDPMRPAQINSLTMTETTHGSPPLNSYLLEWESSSYDNVYYDNSETGYRIYRWDYDTEDWELKATVFGTSYISLGRDDNYFKVSSYNSSGDSYGEYTVSLYPEDVTNIEDHFKYDNYELINYPNPFKSSTLIKYFLPHSSLITLDLYDIRQNHIENLVNDYKQSGYHNYIYHNILSNGSYFVRLVWNNEYGNKSIKISRIIVEK